MGKRLDITPQISAAIKRSTDNSVDPSTVAVFQMAALTSLPLSKKGTLFDGGRVTETTMQQMAAYLNKGTDYVPLHLSHDQSEGALPVGRVFAGDVVSEEGIAVLHNLFYVPLATGADIIAKLETSVIDEGSVVLKPQHINCSECGFDFLGADSTWENIYFRTCGNDHVMGENGAHTLSNGMDKYMELSLVSRGASKNTKIMPRAKAHMGAESYNALAATGVQPELTLLFASPTQPEKKESQMDMTKLVDDLTNVKASVITKDAELVTLNAALAANKTELETLRTENATLKASGVPEIQVKLTAAETSLAAALGVVRAEADRLAVAAGSEKPAADAALETLTASIAASRTKLSEILPVGGTGLGANSQQGESKPKASTASFKTR